MTDPTAPITLYEFTTRVGNTIHGNPQIQNVWITAELSDVAVRGGHFYADLIQKSDDGRTVAKMRANLWANRFNYIRSRYLAVRNEDLRNGIKVKILGSATHHNQFGLSFNIVDLDPDYVDEGDILRRRMEILKNLADQGIADYNKQIPMAVDAQRIAIISAQGAAGLGDFINQLENNSGGFKFTYRVFDSPMQGERAPAGVMNALQQIAAESEQWDCVVIIRGGGATDDMNCFDNLQLASHVCFFPLPVIVGIGHERDNCVLDYIAHTRCKTPTAVAESLIDHQRAAWQAAYDTITRIAREATLRIEGDKQRLAQIEAFVPAAATQMLDKESLRIGNYTMALPSAIAALTSREQTRLDAYRSQLSPAVDGAVSRAMERLKSIFGLVEVLKPENTLRRGYSITRVDGHAVRSAASIKRGTVIETQLADGTLTSTTL